MSNFTNVGITFGNLKDLDPIDITFADNIADFLASIPQKANELTLGYLGLISSSAMFFMLFYLISDLSNFGDFRYSNIRSIGIAACIVSMMGMMFLTVGFFTNYYHIVIFMVITMVATLWVYKEE